MACHNDFVPFDLATNSKYFPQHVMKQKLRIPHIVLWIVVA